MSLILTLINSKLETREFLGLADLPGTQTLYVHESAKVIVIGKYEDFMLRAIKIVFQGLKSYNDG